MFSCSCQAGRFFLCSSIDAKRLDGCMREDPEGKRSDARQQRLHSLPLALTCFLWNSRHSFPLSCSTLSIFRCFWTVFFLCLT